MKTMHYIRTRVFEYVAVCFVVFALSSCNNDGDPTQSQVARGSIMPMKVGNEWVYKISQFDSTGRMLAASFDTDGRWIVSGTPYLIEKYPGRLNETYPIMDSLAGISARVRGIDETVIAPLGTFSAYIYRWTRNSAADVIGEFAYAPNIGLVRSELYARSVLGLYVSSRKELVAKNFY